MRIQIFLLGLYTIIIYDLIVSILKQKNYDGIRYFILLYIPSRARNSILGRAKKWIAAYQ
jgi:hypothetical protein